MNFCVLKFIHLQAALVYFPIVASS